LQYKAQRNLKRFRKKIFKFLTGICPAGGSHTVWECRIAVEEILRQFGMRKLEIFVEGRSAIESLQP
jgi:G:T-mismatch repair DNA endonuclease (very short patch repair protein)